MLNLNDLYKDKIDMIIDTDTYNEIDDQFAVAYMLRNKDKLNCKGITIAPFSNFKEENVFVSIDRSYDEAKKIVKLCKEEEYINKIYRGSRKYLENEDEYIESEACDFIIKESLNYNSDHKLFVVAIGAITNIASAIIKDPSINERIAVVWLGGSAYHYYINREFNMYQDKLAARIVMSKIDDFIMLPCQGVVSEFKTTAPELNYYLAGKGELADYLAKNTIDFCDNLYKHNYWSKVIWDVCAVAVLLNTNNKYMLIKEKNLRLPSLTKDEYEEEQNKKILYVVEIRRDALMHDLFLKMTE